MNKTSNFALRTFPEFKDAAKAISDLPTRLYEPHPGANGEILQYPLPTASINGVFNGLIAKGLPRYLEIIEAKLAETQAAHDVLQDIVRFCMDHPAAQRALPTNFPEGSAARRLLDDATQHHREEFYKDSPDEPEPPLSDIGSTVVDVLGAYLPGNMGQEGISRAEAARSFASTQEDLWRLSAAKGAIQRALATQGEAGARAP